MMQPTCLEEVLAGVSWEISSLHEDAYISTLTTYNFRSFLCIENHNFSLHFNLLLKTTFRYLNMCPAMRIYLLVFASVRLY